jgi:stage III sporulation protein AB
MAASSALNKRVSVFEQLERFVVYLETQIRYSAAPIHEILKQSTKGEFSKLLFLSETANRMCKGECPSDAWENALRLHSDENALNSNDRELLIDFGRGLGTSDVEGQLLHCETFRGLIVDRLAKARSEVETKGKLYVSLGIAGGLGVALLLY